MRNTVPSRTREASLSILDGVKCDAARSRHARARHLRGRLRALTEGAHAGARHVLTGPEALTQVHQAELIGDAIGRPVGWEELSRQDAEREIAGLPDSVLDTRASFVETPEMVTSTVNEITGRPALEFSEWALEHVEDFR
jgi:uncharacterized protein YbjT (DUF2867 family)